MSNIDISALLQKPSNKSINEHGEKLPNGLLSLWTSLGVGYQSLFPLNDFDSVNKYIFWWFHFGQKEHTGLKNEINYSLCILLHRDIIGNQYQITNLMNLIYKNSQNLHNLYPNLLQEKDRKDFCEWWYTYGYKEYYLPFFGISIDKIEELKSEYDLLIDFGYGHNFTKTIRFLYNQIGLWRLEFDINTIEGASKLVRYFFTNVLKENDDINAILTRETIHFLSSVSKNFSDFETVDFINFCYKLWINQNTSNISLPDIWWKNEGSTKFYNFTSCLKCLNDEFFSQSENINDESKVSDIALIGYPQGAFGIGEDVRLISKTLETLDKKYEIYKSSRKVISDSQEFGGFKSIDEYNNENIKIFCMPAFDTLALLHDIGITPFKKGYNIAIWQWELEVFPSEALLAFDLVDEIWTISKHASKAIKQSTNKPVFTIPLPVSIDIVNKASRILYSVSESSFIFYFAFDGASFIARKNPLAIIEAFQRAFNSSDSDVRLIIKGMNIQKSDIWNECLYRANADKRILLLEATLSRNAAYELLNMCDCIVSLHRAEGFGRLIAEALLLNKPVIASNYSGCLDFLSNESAYLVDGDLVNIIPGDYPFYEGNRWFQPDINLASECMQKVYSEKETREKKANFGKLFIQDNYSINSTASFIKNRLRIIDELL